MLQRPLKDLCVTCKRDNFITSFADVAGKILESQKDLAHRISIFFIATLQ